MAVPDSTSRRRRKSEPASQLCVTVPVGSSSIMLWEIGYGWNGNY